MPIKIHIEAETVAELHQHVVDLGRIFTGTRMPELEKKVSVATTPIAAPAVAMEETSEVSSESTSAPKKRGRKPKVSEEPQVASAPEEEAPSQSVASDSDTTAVSDPLAPQASSESEVLANKDTTQYPTREAAVEALRKVTEKFGKEENGKGILLCRAILEKFDARKISEVPEEKRGLLIELCNEVIAKGTI